MSDRELLIKAVEESQRTPPVVAHEGGKPLEAVKSQEGAQTAPATQPERSGEEQQVAGPVPETERIVFSPPKEKSTGGDNTEGAGKPKSEETNPLAGVSSKALVRELVNRLKAWMNKK